MKISTDAIVCGARPHGETGVIARVLTADEGLVAGYVAGGRGRHMRPVLIPGNVVSVDATARSANQLPFLKLELVTSRGPWLSEPLPSAAIGWATGFTAAMLPERVEFPALHAALSALLDAICHAPSARGWVPALISYEALAMIELGHGGNRPQLNDDDWATIMPVFDRMGQLMQKRLLADRAGSVMGELLAARAILRERLLRMI